MLLLYLLPLEETSMCYIYYGTISIDNRRMRLPSLLNIIYSSEINVTFYDQLLRL